MARILLVDDEEVIRDALAKALQKTGYEVSTFEDAGPAMKSTDFNTIDLVITDLLMPIPGEEVIHAIRDQGMSVPSCLLSLES